MNNGELTAKVARTLAKKFERRVDILFDHGDPKLDGAHRVGVIRSWFGDRLTRESLLAGVDMAVVAPQSNRTLLLIEIEESAASPKTILGDIFAIWLGEHFTFQGKRDLQFGAWTTLVVLFHGKPRDNLIAFLTDKLSRFKSAQFGALVVGTFESEADLEKKLAQQIEFVLANLKS